jgi:NAD(P)-dependent dehydrogenase (short-subunit alcohol dehydrogenase family)
MRSFSAQVVLVTGCSSGIGRALVREFDRNGHRTFATARRLETLDDLEGTHIERLRLDVTDLDSVQAAINAVMTRAGRIDMIVNNAGYILAGPLAEVPIDDFKRLFDTNVAGALTVVQAAFPHMANAHSGRVVNIGSIVGVLPTPYAGAYCASKSALHMVSEILRVELAPFGIGVVLVQPASIRSNIAAPALQGLDRYAVNTSYYSRVHQHIEARARFSQDKPMDTDQFAHDVVAAITRRRPPRIIRIGRGAGAYAALAQLPRALLDHVLARRFRLGELRAERGKARK